MKTTGTRFDALVAHLKAHHSYEVPEITATPISRGSDDYLAWISDETGDLRSRARGTHGLELAVEVANRPRPVPRLQPVPQLAHALQAQAALGAKADRERLTPEFARGLGLPPAGVGDGDIGEHDGPLLEVGTGQRGHRLLPCREGGVGLAQPRVGGHRQALEAAPVEEPGPRSLLLRTGPLELSVSPLEHVQRGQGVAHDGELLRLPPGQPGAGGGVGGPHAPPGLVEQPLGLAGGTLEAREVAQVAEGAGRQRLIARLPGGVEGDRVVGPGAD